MSIIDASRRMRTTEQRFPVEWFCTNYSDKSILDVPVAQRLWAWNHKRGVIKQQKFIDSVLHNYPIPNVILNHVGGRYSIYDGRHRIETMHKFYNNEFSIQSVDGPKFYRDLCELDQERFLRRELPATVCNGASNLQLADVFIRLNSGKQLNSSDMYWAHRDRPLVHSTMRLVYGCERLSRCFGRLVIGRRSDLANWIALVYGLSTGIPWNMTTSYIRVAEMGGLDHQVEEARVIKGMDALCEVMEKANAASGVSESVQKRYRKITVFMIYFLAEYMSDSFVMGKWVDVLTRHQQGDKKIKRFLQLKYNRVVKESIEAALQSLNEYLENPSGEELYSDESEEEDEDEEDDEEH